MSTPPIHLAFPFRIRDGVEDHTNLSRYVEQLMELVLFTAKGERVNLPDFGCGIQQLVFQAVDSALVPATLFMVQSELQTYVSGYAVIQEVSVTDEGPKLYIDVRYTLAGSPETRLARYPQAGRS